MYIFIHIQAVLSLDQSHTCKPITLVRCQYVSYGAQELSAISISTH